MEQTLGHVAHTRNLELALAGEDWIEGEIARLPFEAVGIRRIRGLNNWSLRASLMARAALRGRLRRGQLDAAFIHTQVATLLSAGTMRSLPTVVSLDATPRNFDDVGEAYGHRRGGALAEAAKVLVNRRPLMSAAALVTWSRLAADSLIADYAVPGERIYVIPPGVDIGRFRPYEGRRTDGPIRVLFVGGDFKRKGGLDLLAAMQGVPEAELDIVTESVVPPATNGVRCRVHAGLRPGDPTLLELYRQADIFALPTHGDCLPQALAEAAACGLPLVATPTGAISEVVRDGINGFLVAPGSVPDLQGALRALVERPQQRQAMGRESHFIAQRDHDAMANYRRVFELMSEVAGIAARRNTCQLGTQRSATRTPSPDGAVNPPIVRTRAPPYGDLCGR
jgi:hypothetical protein